MVQQHRYPRVVEAKVFNGVVLYHGAFEPYPAGTFDFETHHGIAPDVFTQRNDSLRRDGFRLVHKQSVHFGGREFVQTTWVRTAQALSPAQQAMQECQARYKFAGSQMWVERWPFVEACFKEKTGLYPGQANVDCHRRFLYGGKLRDRHC
jgi:Bacterial tandem repeat domain 1